MKEEQKRKNIIYLGIKPQEIAEEIKQDLNNKQPLFCRGFVDFENIYILKLDDTTPKGLRKFEEEGDYYFNKNMIHAFIMELDTEKAEQRRLWGLKRFIICDFDKGKARPLNNESLRREYYINKDFKHLDSFWRVGDYESARKCAKNIYFISKKPKNP